VHMLVADSSCVLECNGVSEIGDAQSNSICVNLAATLPGIGVLGIELLDG
jgi:hypothetical protein